MVLFEGLRVPISASLEWRIFGSKEPSHVSIAFKCTRFCAGGFCIRAYVPNVMVSERKSASQEEDTDITGLALVATRPLQDEEILLNYRLSTHVDRPSWYHSVDKAEDERRWS